MDRKISTARDHRQAAGEAGLHHVSIISLLAGLVTAYGGFAILAALGGSILASANVDTEFRTNDWTGSGAAAAATSALVLLLSYLFGGYVAGRMARRAGALHGVLLFLAALIVGAVVGGAVSLLTDDEAIRSNLRSIGVPTSTAQVTNVAIAGVMLSLAAILVGSTLGGILGERWHTKLARRITDPEVGTSAVERNRLREEQAARQERIERDPTVATSYQPIDRDARHSAPAAEPQSHDDASDDRYTEAEWRLRDSESTR